MNWRRSSGRHLGQDHEIHRRFQREQLVKDGRSARIKIATWLSRLRFAVSSRISTHHAPSLVDHSIREMPSSADLPVRGQPPTVNTLHNLPVRQPVL
jgi:hypothetical protein